MQANARRGQWKATSAECDASHSCRRRDIPALRFAASATAKAMRQREEKRMMTWQIRKLALSHSRNAIRRRIGGL